MMTPTRTKIDRDSHDGDDDNNDDLKKRKRQNAILAIFIAGGIAYLLVSILNLWFW